MVTSYHWTVTVSNQMTLKEARKNFIEYGVCKKEFISSVRKPKKDEIV